MAKKAIGKRHAIFIQQMIDIGDTPEGQIKAYRIAYPSCKSDNTARTNSHRLLQNAEISNPIDEGRKLKAQIIADARKESLKKEAEQNLLSQVEVDAILCSIIKGQHKNIERRPMFNPDTRSFQIITVEVPPGATEIVSAIDKYNKRFGAYAPKKIQTNDEPDKVILPGEEA